MESGIDPDGNMDKIITVMSMGTSSDFYPVS